MLGFFKNKSKGKVICSPCNGRVVPITEVPDPTFSEKILGDGVAVIPSEGRFYAPADGEVTAVFDTLHAFTMTTTQGVRVAFAHWSGYSGTKGGSFYITYFRW